MPKEIAGYAAVFYDGTSSTEFPLFEDYVERFMPGAFDKTLSDDIFGLFNHDQNLILGRSSAGTLQLRTDDKGLRYVIEKSPTTLWGDVYQWQQRRELTGGSIGFRAIKETFIQDGDLTIRELHEVELRDVGPVTYPAYEATSEGRSIRQVDMGCRPVVPAVGVDEVRSAVQQYRARLDRVRVRARAVSVY